MKVVEAQKMDLRKEGAEQTPLLVVTEESSGAGGASHAAVSSRWAKSAALVAVVACTAVVAVVAAAGTTHGGAAAMMTTMGGSRWASLGQSAAESAAAEAGVDEKQKIEVDESALGDMFHDPLMPTYYPITDGNIVVPVSSKFVPAEGTDDAWDADLVASVSALAGVDPNALALRDVVYEVEFSAYFTGYKCDDVLVTRALEMAMKSALSVSAIKTEDCHPEQIKPDTVGIPVIVSTPRSAMLDPNILLKDLEDHLTPELFASIEGTGTFDGIANAELSAVAVIEGPPEILAVSEQIASPPPAMDFFSDFKKDLVQDASDLVEGGEEEKEKETELMSAGEDDEEEDGTVDWVAPNEDKLHVADYPPAPSIPPFPDAKNRVPLTLATATLTGKENPKPIKDDPEPTKEGNNVVTVPVANVPKVGFSDKQIEMIKANKAKNAGLAPNSLVVRGFYFSIFDFFYLTHSNCGGDIHSAPPPIFQKSLRAPQFNTVSTVSSLSQPMSD